MDIPFPYGASHTKRAEYLDIFEVKSARTYNTGFSKNLKYLKQLFGEKIKTSAIIYDGDYIPPDVVNICKLTEKF